MRDTRTYADPKVAPAIGNYGDGTLTGGARAECKNCGTEIVYLRMGEWYHVDGIKAECPTSWKPPSIDHLLRERLRESLGDDATDELMDELIAVAESEGNASRRYAKSVNEMRNLLRHPNGSLSTADILRRPTPIAEPCRSFTTAQDCTSSPNKRQQGCIIASGASSEGFSRGMEAHHP